MFSFKSLANRIANSESLRSKVFFVIISTFTILVTVISGYYIYLIYGSAEKYLQEYNTEVGDKMSVEIRMPIYRAIGVARTLSMTSDYLFKRATASKDSLIGDSFKNLAKNLSYYNDKHLYLSYFLSLKNEMLPDAAQLAGRTVYEQTVNQSALAKSANAGLTDSPRDVTISRAEQQKKVIVSAPYYAQSSGSNERVLVVSIAAPITYNQKIAGCAGVEIPLTEMQKQLEQLNLPNDATAFIVANNDIIVAHTRPKFIGTPLADVSGSSDLESICTEFYSNTYEDLPPKINKESSFTRFMAPVIMDQVNTTWVLGIAIPNSELYKAQREYTIIGIAVAILCLALIIFLTSKFVNMITSPILRINEVINKLSKGEVSSTQAIDISSKTEIGRIESSINTLIDGLNKTSEFAVEIGKGNFNAEHKLLSENDDIGHSLVEMKTSLIKAQELEKERQKEQDDAKWFNEGIARFAEILRQNNSDIKALSYEIVSNLVRYIDAAQGGMFIQNEENTEVLEMTACFAYNRKKQLLENVAKGEGLVGRCFDEAEKIYLLEIPENYLSITSGLGITPPTSILLMPLKVNNTVLGVIELASFKQMDENTIKFVEKVSESIAATLTSVRINIRTSRLLEQTKLQAEEMAAAEEEMRQNLEELQSTQEEMNRIQSEQAEMVRQSEITNEMMSILMQNSSDLFYMKDTEGRFISISQSEEFEKVGLNQDAIGKTNYDLFPFEVADPVMKEELGVITSGKPLINSETTFTLPDGGGERTIRYSKIPIKLKDGTVTGLFAIYKLGKIEVKQHV